MSGTKVIPESGQPHCPQCGTLLPSGALAGLCPACLLQIGAAADTVTDGKQPAFVPPTIAELAPLFPQLEILELIGKGGMGAVYKARQKELDRIVALKILPPGIGTDAAFAARFAREAKALAKLNHSGIVTLFEFGSCAGLDLEKEKGRKGAGEQQPPGNEVTSAPLPPFSPAPSGSRSSTCDARPPLYYFLMEFVDGLNLRQLLHAGRIAPREALAIVPQICEALQFAHDLGIVHRDIKPENILLDRRGRVKVADFGLAKIVGGNELLSRPSDTLSQSDGERAGERGDLVLTEAGKVMGTPQYMSPEQFDAPGEVDHRADIYALGVVFYQMLTGELPGKKIEAPSKKVQIDVRLDEVVLRALEKKPELRYQHASVLKTELETLAAEARQSDVSVPKTVVRPDRLLAPVNAGFAAAVTFFYAGVVLSILLIGVLPFRFSRDYAYLLGVGLVLVVTPFVGVAVTNALRQMQASGDNIRWQALVARLKAASVVAWLLALPVIGFAIFFLIALFSERGGWNPAISEAVLVPLTWLGAVLLPLSGKRLWEAAAPGSRGRESVPPESERAQAHQGPLTSAATVQEPRLSYPAVAGAGWALLLGICLLAENLGLNTSVLGPLSLLAPVTTTLLGWISVSQIRRSGRKTYGLKLAVFDGLLFPLLALNAVLLYAPAKPAADLLAGVLAAEQKLALVIWVACAAPFWWAFDWWVIRRVWRAVKSSSDGRDRKTPRAPDRASRVVWAGALVVATAILGIVLATFFFARNGSTNDIASLVNQPHKLRSLPNAMVIQVGLAEPKSAWAWQELEKRAQKGLLDHHEILQIVDGFTAWMRHEHPEGYHQPLFWFGGLLDALHTKYLVGETNTLAFLDAYNGNPFLDPLPRARENASLLRLTCQWRGSWLNQHSLGFELLNEMRSISVDGIQVPVQDDWRRGRWKDQSFTAALKLPKLDPGKHLVRCEIESAFVATLDMAGLAEDATSIDWPPAKRRWTRSCEAEFMVYAAYAEIVSLADDPALNPVAGGALSVRPIIIRPERGRLMATVSFNAEARPGLPIGVDVTLRLAGQTIKCGKLFEVRTAKRGSSGPEELTVEIEPLDPQIKEAEILLTPNPKAVEEYPYVDRIWGKEIVLSNVPLSRQDLYGANHLKTTSVPDKLSFGPVIERTIYRVATGTNSLIQFKTGALSSPPPGSTNSIQTVHRWTETQGADAAVGVVGADVLSGFDMVMVRAPANCWDELTPTQAVRRLEVETRSSFQIMAYGSSFPETSVFKTRDGGIGILQVLQLVNDPPGLNVRYKFLAQPPVVVREKFDPAAAPETWSPELLPGEKPDLSKILAEAKELMTKTKYAESLARLVWFYNHAQEFGDSYVRRTSALSEWVELGRRYPKARAALLKIRDAGTREFSEGRGYADLFEEVVGLNQHLNDEGATCVLFKFVAQHDTILAQQCYGHAEAALRQCGEYELCLSFLGDPQAKFESLRQSWGRTSAMPPPGGGIPAMPIRATLPERVLRSSSTNGVGSSVSVPAVSTNPIPVPPVLAPVFPTPPNMAQWAENYFVGQVCNLIEILVGADRLAVAGKIRDQALALLDDVRLKSAVSDAGETVRKVRASPRRAKSESPPLIISPGASTNTNAPLVSAENWSPALAPGEQPDVDKIRKETRELMQQGRYEDALQRHIWYHNHALEYSSSHAGVRLSFALSEWVELSRRYPKARQALAEIRDIKTRELSEERGYAELFQDVVALNRELQTADATYELFKTLEQRDPDLARQCYFYAEDVLVDKGEFELCLRYLGDPQKKFESIRASLERMTAMQKRTEESYRRFAGTNSPVRLSVTAEHQERYFVSQTRRLIEILVGAGRKTEAEKIQAQAVSALNVPELQSAVSEAEEKVRSKLVQPEKK